MGNLRSVQKAFEISGTSPRISDKPREIERADKIVVPGVGAFGQAMRQLGKKGLIPVLRDKIQRGTPYLGLCLGLQILFASSEESAGAKGLGIVPGRVKRFSARAGKVPHMGWNTVKFQKKGCPLFKGVSSGEHFYFVHSYFVVPEDVSWVVARTPYGGDFCSAVWKDNLFATQFHPEKSQGMGLKVIRNFVEYDPK